MMKLKLLARELLRELENCLAEFSEQKADDELKKANWAKFSEFLHENVLPQTTPEIQVGFVEVLAIGIRTYVRIDIDIEIGRASCRERV